jgi:hypothetical protein
VVTWILCAALLLTLCAVLSLFVAIARLDAVPMPSSAGARRAIIEEARAFPDMQRIVDLGSGWGGLARELAAAFPGKDVVGVEASLVPLLFARVRRKVAGGPANVSYRRHDFRSLSVADDTLYVAYLSPAAMKAVGGLLEDAGDHSVALISALFAVREWQPIRTRTANDLHRTQVFVYDRSKRSGDRSRRATRLRRRV